MSDTETRPSVGILPLCCKQLLKDAQTTSEASVNMGQIDHSDGQPVSELHDGQQRRRVF